MTARPKIALPVATDEGPLPDFLYHGTSTRYLKQILRKGLAPCHMTGAVLMCCYADDPVIAWHHAECMAEAEDADPVLFRIPIARFDTGKFTLDDKFVELGPSAGRGVAAYVAAGEAEWENAPWTWRSMLHAAGAVGYVDTVPVSRDDLVASDGCPEAPT